MGWRYTRMIRTTLVNTESVHDIWPYDMIDTVIGKFVTCRTIDEPQTPAHLHRHRLSFDCSEKQLTTLKTRARKRICVILERMRVLANSFRNRRYINSDTINN